MNNFGPDNLHNDGNENIFPTEFAEQTAHISQLQRDMQARQHLINYLLHVIDIHSKDRDSKVGIFPKPHNP